MSIDNVSDITPRVQYVASAAQTVFAYPFPIFADADLKVYVDGVLKALSTHYTVSGEGDDTGGNVTFLSGMAGDEVVTIYRDIAIERDTDVSQNGPWSSESHNDEMDKVFLLLQQQKADHARAIRIPKITNVDDDDIELSPTSAWASKFLAFDANGKPEPATAIAQTTLTQSIIAALLTPQTPAESSGGVTPASYVYSPDIPVRDLRRDGVSKSGTASANYTGIMKAIDWAVARSGGIIRLPDGQVPFNGKITIPTAVVLEGETMGFGSNVSTVLYYTGSGIAIQVDGYYSRLKDFTLKQAGTGTVGVFVTATQFMMDRVTIVPDASTGFSDAGYQTDPSGVTFTHLLNRVYIYGCEIGVDFTWGNNFVLSECFIESCDTDVRVGWAGLVTNFVCGNGSVIELFGDGRGAESNASICLDLVNVKAFSLIDSYLEVNGTGTVGAAGQVGVNLRADAKGGKIARNWFYGGGQALTAINAQDGSVVSVDDNYFQSFNGYAITEVAGARVIAGPGNQYAVGTGIVDRDEAPSPTGLTVVNGTGGATYALNWDLVGNYVHFTLNINVTGDCTTASVAGTTYFPLAGAMLAPIAEGQCTATRQDFVALTGSTHVGGVATNSRIYTPTWTAVNASIRVRGSYRWR